MMYQGGSLKVLKLECSFQNNAWGKLGSESMVVRLVKSADDSFNIDENEHYAELWMGTHPTCPSVCYYNGERKESLDHWLRLNPSAFGSEMDQHSDGQLPFLMKVLSIRNTLAIQIHPDKVSAQKLHQERPDIYKDPNHKPEMAIALTPFKAMCGFRPIKEVAKFTKIKPFRRLIGSNNAMKLSKVSQTDDHVLHNQAMKDCFTALMNQDRHMVQNQIGILLKTIQDKELSGQNVQYYIPDIINKINTEYPGDVGIFAIYFLNIVDLQPGEAIFIDANIPHAYIYGDCLECMASSHNVIRAGLTFKYRDVNTFCNTVNYTGRSAEDMKLQSNQIQLEIGISETKFQPHVPDFAVSVIKILSGNKTVHLTAIDSASICLVYTGEGQASSSSLTEPIKLKTGIVFFIAACHTVSVDVQSNDMTIFRACYNTSETFSKVASAF
ncbi:mannose-6-phosphate isomerase-like isoform X1 [Mytilus galloprovincialis]|uniref:mannose-6-phosphate isomerase-like isoform X1 n=2 Tax=Mytilus galloprovincialis TaxID=29158 RepID=UPI003F7BF4CC